MRFASLGSGSRGNCTLVRSAQTCVMIDCGFSLRDTRRRLERAGLEPEDISGILVTHEHTDHAKGVAALARRHGVTVYATRGTAESGYLKEIGTLHTVQPDTPFRVGDLEILPVPVPHDAREPVQYVFEHGARRLGVLTDTGKVTPHIEASYAACDALMLECNHDRRMLMEGPYSPSLKRRVASDYGHLSNEQAAGLVEGVDQARLQHLVVTHISEKNNLPELARGALETVLEVGADLIRVAHQDRGLDWCEIA